MISYHIISYIWDDNLIIRTWTLVYYTEWKIFLLDLRIFRGRTGEVYWEVALSFSQLVGQSLVSPALSQCWDRYWRWNSELREVPCSQWRDRPWTFVQQWAESPGRGCEGVSGVVVQWGRGWLCREVSREWYLRLLWNWQGCGWGVLSMWLKYRHGEPGVWRKLSLVC